MVVFCPSGTSTSKVEVPSDATASSSLVAFLAGFSRFRLSVALTFAAFLVAALLAVSLTEALFVFLGGLTDVDFPLIELLIERGAAASASEVLLGLDDDAVDSTTFFCLLVAALLVASAAVFALRLAGAMSSIFLGTDISKLWHSEVCFDQIYMRVTARMALTNRLAALDPFPSSSST